MLVVTVRHWCYKINKMNKINEKEGIFNQSVTDPQHVREIWTDCCAYIRHKAAFGVHILVVWWGQDSMHSWHYATSVPSMSSSCPWLPSRVRDRKGAKSTNVSLSRGATFSKALSSFVVMLSKQTNQKSHKKMKQPKLTTDIREVILCSSSWQRKEKSSVDLIRLAKSIWREARRSSEESRWVQRVAKKDEYPWQHDGLISEVMWKF